MRKFLASLFVLLAATPSLATFPQDDFRNYLIVLVHGLGGDTNVIGKSAYPKHCGWLETSTYYKTPEYKAAVKEWDTESSYENYYGGLFEFLTDSLGVDSSHVRYYEMSRPCNGFYNEPEHPGMPTTSKELGDRTYDNPGANRWPRAKAPGIRLRFGIEKDPVSGKGLSWLEQALKDWEHTWRARHPDFPFVEPIPDSEYPKKYILIGHSMGGLTIRSYLASNFYQNDVEKVISVASPAAGSEVVSYIHQAGMHGWRFLENDWNRDFLAKTIAEGMVLYVANNSGQLSKAEKALDARTSAFAAVKTSPYFSWYPADPINSQNFMDNSDCFGACDKGSMSSLKDFGSMEVGEPVSDFLVKKMVILAGKTYIDEAMEWSNAAFGHYWEDERGVQQLEPLATNQTGAIAALNEFRFPDTTRYIPKLRASGIGAVPSPEAKPTQAAIGEILQEALEWFDLLFPQYTEVKFGMGQIARRSIGLAVDRASDPYMFGSVQSMLNTYTSKIGFYLTQNGDFAVPEYSAMYYKDVERKDRIEFAKQADFRYSDIPYDPAPNVGTSITATKFGLMGWDKLADLGLIPGGYGVHFIGKLGIAIGGGLWVSKEVGEPLPVWLGAHGQAMGYVGDRRSMRSNSIGQSIIENQLWDAPSVSITAMRRAD